MSAMTEERLWTYEDVARRWGVSLRQAKRRLSLAGLQPLDLGHRTKRWRPATILNYEARLSGERSGEKGRFSLS